MALPKRYDIAIESCRIASTCFVDLNKRRMVAGMARIVLWQIVCHVAAVDGNRNFVTGVLPSGYLQHIPFQLLDVGGGERHVAVCPVAIHRKGLTGMVGINRRHFWHTNAHASRHCCSQALTCLLNHIG